MRRSIIVALLVSAGTVAAAAIVVPSLGRWPADVQRAWSRMQSFGFSPNSDASRNVPTAVRVKVAAVAVEDVPIYLSAIGTVQAYNTASIKTRVDGQITEVLFEEGQDVQVGDPLVIIDPRPYKALLEQQEATRLKDQAQLEQSLLDLHRFETLIKNVAIPQQQLDQQRALVDQLKAQVQNDIAQIDYARTHLEYTTIRAPFSGRLGVRQVDLGNILYFKDNTTIVVLTQLRPISVIFTLAAEPAAQNHLTLGQVKVPVIAFGPDFKTELDRGTVDLLDNQVDQTTGTLKLKASFPNDSLRLWPGNFINGRIVVDKRENGTTVPSIAVRFGPRGNFVWIVRPDNTVEARSVTVAQAFNGRTLIEKGVSSGELIVTDGYFLLENGKSVKIVETEPPLPGSRPSARLASEPR